jgi:hypothetical protein
MSSRIAPQRIVVVGTTGSGKSSLAARLARYLNAPHVELDALYWGPDWTPVGDAVFRERVRLAAAETAWVADGNYSAVRDLLWPRAEMIVWLDPGLGLILWRLLRRTLRRWITREDLWGTNQERLWAQFTRQSLFLWALTTYRRRRRDYAHLFQVPDYAHIHKVRLRSPRETDAWWQDFTV